MSQSESISPAGSSTSEEFEAVAALRAAILASDAGAGPIARLLDGLPDALRPRVVRRLGRREQAGLYAAVEGALPLSIDDLASPDRAPLEEVRHLGRNTLPAFRIFEKRFCRLPGDDPGLAAGPALAGYNHQTMMPLTGPGYFLARDDAGRGEVLIDYSALPGARPPDWPRIRSNERGPARLVYGFMVDRLRRVSQHVTVGSAAKRGRDLGSYFVLCREP